jgi:hypothetical protein
MGHFSEWIFMAELCLMTSGFRLSGNCVPIIGQSVFALAVVQKIPNAGNEFPLSGHRLGRLTGLYEPVEQDYWILINKASTVSAK